MRKTHLTNVQNGILFCRMLFFINRLAVVNIPCVVKIWNHLSA